MSKEDLNVPFSQRVGIVEIPPQLQLGEISQDFRRLIHYRLSLEMEPHQNSGFDSSYFDGTWKRVTQDAHVLLLGQDISTYRNSSYHWEQTIKKAIWDSHYAFLFDLIEFFCGHSLVSTEAKVKIEHIFVECRAAYRLVENKVVAVGTGEQAAAIVGAVSQAERTGQFAAKAHLKNSGVELKNGNWAASVRESINAVEAVAVNLAPEKGSLGAALSQLERHGQIHGGLKKAFGALYGYTSDEEGIRHALVFEDVPNVDETDALFMLGSCASFVSFLLARKSQLSS